MKNKIRWYSDGELGEPEELEIKFEPLLRIAKFKHNDQNSFNGFRYWVIDEKNQKILISPKTKEFRNHGTSADKFLFPDEIELVKNNKIKLSNNNAVGDVWYYSDLIKAYNEEEIYF